MSAKLTYILPVGLVLLLFWRIPFVDYAYLDEAHQLWHNKDGSNFVMFANQGRFITGWIINGFFDQTETIAGLKYLRIFSLVGWCLVILLWQYLIHRWNNFLLLPELVINFSSIFLACSLPVAIYIGWASCLEVFIGFAAAILSGHLLFMQLAGQKEQASVSPPKILLIAFLGLISLFVYQNCFGCFLLPFGYYFFFVSRKIDKKLIIAISFYLVILIVYYLLFKCFYCRYNIGRLLQFQPAIH